MRFTSSVKKHNRSNQSKWRKKTYMINDGEKTRVCKVVASHIKVEMNTCLENMRTAK